MTNFQVFGLGLLVAGGLALHAVLSRPPRTSSADPSENVIQPSDSVRKTMMEVARDMAPKTLAVGDHALVLRGWFEVEGGGTSHESTRCDWKFYEYKDGKLIEVPTVSK